MRKLFKIFFLSVCTVAGFQFLTIDEAAAQDLTGRYSPRLMQGMRPQGMGGAFIAVDGSDENAIFYNPASINDYEKEIHMQFLLPTVEFSINSISYFSSDIPDLADDIDAAATDGAKIAAFRTFAANNTGRYEEVGFHGSLATFMYKYVTASIFYDNRSVIGLLNPASTTVDVEASTTGGVQVGTAYSFFDDHLQAGIALKFAVRHLIDETVTERDVIANADFGDIFQFDRVGFGVGVDVGFQGKLPISGKTWDYLDPTFALTIQDIADTRFAAGDDVGRIEESTSLGLALHPKFGKFTSIFALDVRDLEHQTDFITKLHAGYELTWPDIGKVLRSASVRIGMNQGYIAGGFGVDFRYFKLNFATYGREVGTVTRQKQSRMIGIQLAAGF